MAGGGSSSSSSTPVDMTPAAFQGLQGPYAAVIGQLLGYNIQTPGGSPMSPVTFNYPAGQFPQGVGGNAANAAGTSAGQMVRHRFGGMSPNSGSDGGGVNRWVPGQQQQGGPGFTLTNPNLGTGNPNDILNGIPTYQGPLTAGLGANEQSLLDQLMAGSGGGAGTGTAGGLDAATAAFLQRQMSGDFLPVAGATGEANPFLQAAIQAAQRPTLQGLEETLTRSLPGRFTSAGQFTQPQGTSAFDRAAALATRGAADANADIATKMSYQQFSDQAQRDFEGSQKAQDRQISAAGLAPQVSTTQVQNMVSNLQAQALPRLIQEYGIERGMDEFNNRVNSLLSVIGIAGGVTQPTISNKSESESTTKPNILPAL